MRYRSGGRDGLVDARSRLERLHVLGGTGADAALVLTESWLPLLSNQADAAIALMGSDALRQYAPVASMAGLLPSGAAWPCRASRSLFASLETARFDTGRANP
jgi:hypothetical protein